MRVGALETRLHKVERTMTSMHIMISADQKASSRINPFRKTCASPTGVGNRRLPLELGVGSAATPLLDNMELDDETLSRTDSTQDNHDPQTRHPQPLNDNLDLLNF